MGVFQCHLCNLISEDESKIKVHMKLSHNMKVEDDDMLVEKLFCPVCPYATRNMTEYKNHMVAVHKKDKWNWSLELKASCFCDECDVEFPDKTKMRQHMQGGHRGVSRKSVPD